MSVNKTWNGVTYSIPNTRSESGWETTLSTYLQALADNAATTTFNKQAVRKATTTPVTVSASTDCTIIVDLTGPGASTVNLPAGADKQIFVIVDGKGDASTNNITIDANGSETIEGSLTKVIRLNRECLVLQYSSSAGDWKVIGGYVPNMVGGPASATDNAIARFDSTTGKLIQNSGATVDDSNQVSAASFTATGGTAANNTMYVASNALRLRGGTSGLSFFNTSGTETFNASDVGALTLGPSTGSGLTHILQSGASTNLELLGAGTYSTRLKFNASGGNGMILIPSASSLLFRDNANTTTLGELSAAGAWTLGPSTLAKHTINGRVKFSLYTESGAGPFNNYALGNYGVVAFTNGGAVILTGITGGADGDVIHILCGAGTLRLDHNSGSSSAGNKLYNKTGANITLAANGGVTAVYTSGGWFIIYGP